MKALTAFGVMAACFAAPALLRAGGNGSETANITAVVLPAHRGEMNLEEVLSAAARKREREAADIEAAQAQVHLLESANRRRFDLKPELGLVSLSNPLLLATSMGFSLLSGSPTNATRFALEAARLDLVLATESGKRAALRRRVLVSRQYFELAERQQAAERVCASVPDLEARRPQVARLASAGKMTAIDELQFEQEVLERRTGCVRALEDRRAAAVLMATTAGLAELEPRVAEPGQPIDFEDALPPLDVLVRVAFAHRPERSMLEDEMAAARAPLGSRHKSWLPDLQLGYSKLSESTGLRTGDTLLGGNIVHPAGTFTIPLRDTGERSAEREVITARLRRLDTEMTMIEQEISTELANTRIKAEADAERVGIARQRLELAEKARTLVTARFENGLTGPDAVFAAERFESLARLQAIEAGYASAASRQSIVMLCGLSQMPPSERQVVFTANARPNVKPGTNRVEGIAHGGY